MGGAILSHLLEQENSTDKYHVIDRNFKAKQHSLLKERVTSPKGITQSALSVFSDNNNLANLIQAAVGAAAERSRELSY